MKIVLRSLLYTLLFFGALACALGVLVAMVLYIPPVLLLSLFGVAFVVAVFCSIYQDEKDKV